MSARIRNENASLAVVHHLEAPASNVHLNPTPLRRPGLVPLGEEHEGLRNDPRVVELMSFLFSDAETVDRLSGYFAALVERTLATRPKDLIESDRARLRDPLWLLDEVQYMGYVNFIGASDGRGTFKTLEAHLDSIMGDLGATTIYALPFLESPFGDAGFDVSDYRKVDPRFGGNDEFRAFRRALARKGGKLQMDLVLNHVSDQHQWAKRVRSSDLAARDYFHVLTEAPAVLSVELDAGGLPLRAKYAERDENGNEITVERRVVFPAFANPHHPHYTVIQDSNGTKLWVYHTFYPFQWDLNFSNPEVVEESLDILAYWVNEGADVFRLDAIPHLYKQMESDPRIMKVVELLRYFVAQTSPRTSIIVEANQSPKIVSKYFGEAASIKINALDEVFETSSGAQLAYNFDQAIHTWASLLTGQKKYLLEGIERTPLPPANTLWGYFLRVHDELSLSKAPDEIRDIIQKELIETGRGVPFRGARGVGGRMANFLDHDPRRQIMAFAHLLSLDGHPILYYGDEILTSSNNAYAKSAAEDRGGYYDSRDEGRGPVSAEDYRNAKTAGQASEEGRVFEAVRRLIDVRRERLSLRRGQMQVIETNHPSIVAYKRTYSHDVANIETTLVIFNLAGEAADFSIDQSPGIATDLITGNNFELLKQNSGVFLTLQPYEVLWLSIS